MDFDFPLTLSSKMSMSMPMSIFQISKSQCQCQCQFSRDSQNQCQCQCQYLQKSQCQWVFQYYCSCLQNSNSTIAACMIGENAISIYLLLLWCLDMINKMLVGEKQNALFVYTAMSICLAFRTMMMENMFHVKAAKKTKTDNIFIPSNM